VAERSLKFPLISTWDGRGVNQGRRDLDRFRRDSGRTFDRAGTESGRRYGMRLSKSLGGGFSASTGIVSRGARAMGGALAAIGIVKLGTDAVTMAATFDKTMRQTAQVAKVPQRQMGELRKVALDMGASTSFSARQAGEAMLALGKGGLSFAEQKAGALQASLTLAAAGGLELGQSAEFVVQGLRTFGLRAGRAGDVAAALAGAANASTASVEDMGLALSQTGAGARNAGLSLQETTGVLAAFANNGIKGSDAGTSLKTMLQRLVAPTGKARAEMDRLGLSFTNARGEILPITVISQRLQDRLGGLSEAQRGAALQTIFGSDATRAATVLMREGFDGVAKYIKATSDRAAAEDLAKTNTEGAAGALERLQGAIETVSIKAGDSLLPMVADIASTIADRVIPAVEKWVGAFRDDLAPHLGRMKDAWDANKGAIMGLVTGLAGSQAQMGETAGKAKTLADSVVTISHAAGDASRALTNLGNGLNLVADEASNESGFGGSLRRNVVGPIDNFIFKVGEAIGANDLFRFILRDVKADLADVGIKLGGAAAETDKAKGAADRHTGALRAERDAVNALKSALDGEKTAELDVRQAKLNVASAQSRLTGLVKGGRKGSLEYKQAQIDLQRAQIDLKNKTIDYRGAQQKATSATGGAMRAAQNAQGPYQTFGSKAEIAGKKARTMGANAREGIMRIPSRTVTIRATFGFKTPPGVSMHDIVGATGGKVTPRAIVPMRRARGGPVWGAGTTTSDSIPAYLSNQEHVWDADAVKGVGGGNYQRGHKRLAAMRKEARGYADGGPVGYAVGGPVLKADFPLGTSVGRVGRRFEAAITRAISRLAGRWDRYAEKTFGGLGKPGVLRFIRSTDRLPYIWGGAGPGGYDCSGLVGAVHLAHLGRPYGHGQRMYTTSSIHAGAGGLKPGLGGTLQIGVTAGSGHMAGKYGKLGFEAESSRTGIKIGSAASRPESFARHFHLARGGPIDPRVVEELTRAGALDIGGDQARMRINGQVFNRGGRVRKSVYDAGGWLMPGTTVAQNNTGKPERVVPSDAPVELGAASRRALARDIADALAQAGLGQVSLDGRRVDRQLRTAALLNSRR
jgi:TP901 family phage tail tape measure protein